ncbi:vWA domain-containing protein [Dactylosporangium sp. CA-092794]|uniref:vWA domain-containing protein n=1 Tax=Dactylosporangium sp. CA-092794 TaxID=3239929 RepID=UPI003D8FC4AB
MARGKKAPPDPRLVAARDAWAAVVSSPLFDGLAHDPAHTGGPALGMRWAEDTELVRARGYARVHPDGVVVANKLAPLAVEEWIWVFAHCALHLGFGHTTGTGGAADSALAVARCVAVARFQEELRIGRSPMLLPELPVAPEEALAERWRTGGIPDRVTLCCAGGAAGDVAAEPDDPRRAAYEARRAATLGTTVMGWPDRLAVGLGAAAAAAVQEAGEVRATGPRPVHAGWEAARRWFISSYPLLAGLAAGFTLVSEYEVVRRLDIAVAAVDADLGEIYVNPFAPLSAEERRFVIAHEMLHAALRHGDRVGPRDPYLWNIATDYVINGWLVEMALGDLPEGALHDPQFAGAGAEEVYDRIATDLRRLRRLGTLRGRGLGDILGGEHRHPGHRGTELDEYYRRALATGLAYHESQGRGLLPAGLVEEIRALDHPPLPWDAQLARWFAEHVRSPQPRRSYARPSRRQSASPGIPRPGWFYPEEEVERCTFGVVLDTSGSMDRTLLGKALGAIASYAVSRAVPAARVVFCDAAAYDAGYLPVEEIAGRVRVKGRGGTTLQPGIRLLERADDFPADAPILIITDGECDVLRVRREHAFLVPDQARLPFTPRGPVFRLR